MGVYVCMYICMCKCKGAGWQFSTATFSQHCKLRKCEINVDLMRPTGKSKRPPHSHIQKCPNFYENECVK